jgi:hypothetical protein
LIKIVFKRKQNIAYIAGVISEDEERKSKERKIKKKK